MTDQYQVERFARDFARRLARLERKQRSTAAAPADLRHSALDHGSGIPVKDEHGNTTAYVGAGPTGIEHVAGPVPARPAPVFVDAGQRVVKVQHSGLDMHEDLAPADFHKAEVHVSQDATFDPSLSTYAVNLDTANGSVTHSLPAGEWYVGIVWVTLSGQRSVMSEPVLAVIEPPVDAQDIQDTLDTAQEALDEYRENVASPRFQALETGLSESNDNLADARTRLSAAEQTLSPLPGRVELAEQDVAAAQVEATKAAAAAVEANNRAMTRLANGNFESDLLYWEYERVTLDARAHSGSQAARINSNGWLRPGSSFPVVPDQIWELSLYYQYDVTVELQTVDGDQRATLFTHHLDGDSSWSDSGALRVTIPAEAHMLSFTITGTAAIVDDITLRDVTDVVRLEEAANANRVKAEQAISELAVMRLAVDGEGGLKDRLDSAENDLENIDTELDQVATNLTTALTGPVDHTRLRAGEGAFDTGFIGELWAGNIRALAAELARATIAAPNLWPDPDFEQDVYGSWTRVDGGIERNGSESLSVSYVSDDGFYIPIEYDVPYRITVDFSLNGPGRGEVWLRDADANKTYIGSTARSNFQSNSGTFNITYMPSSNSNGQARYMYLGFGTRNTDPSTRLRFENLKIERMTDGSLIVENSVTAEKIHATRELITKIMGAEWAYIAQQLIVDGSILTRDLEALSAAIQSLTVTQRADIAELWAEELRTALAVIEELQAEEAWITSAMISELTAEKVTVTQEFVARIGTFAEILGDKLWANEAFIDRMAASEAYFGSEDADQQTRVDGTGLRITKYNHANETSTDIVRLGGLGIGLTFSNEQGDHTGSLSHDGDAILKDVNTTSLTMAGRPLQNEACNDYYHPSGDQSLLTFRPRGVAGRNHRSMPALTSDYTEWGFMDVTTPLHAGRIYRISLGPIYTFTDNTTNQLRIRYSQGNSPVRIISPLLRRARYGTQSGAHGSHISGEWYFIPEETDQYNFLATIYNAQGVRLPAGYTGDDGDCWIVVEDIGLDPGRSGQDRDTRGSHKTSGINNEDTVGGVETYTTTWEATWFQTYRNNGQTPVESGHGYGEYTPNQGWRGINSQYYTSMFGFAGATESTKTTELGQTFQAALAGATIRSITLELTGEYSRLNNYTLYRLLYSARTNPPQEYFPSGQSPYRIGDYRIDVGQTRRIVLPVLEYGSLLHNGELQTIGLSPLSNPELKYTGALSWDHRPKITITYQR